MMIIFLWIVVSVLVCGIFSILIAIRNLNETMRLNDEARDFNLRQIGFKNEQDGEQ